MKTLLTSIVAFVLISAFALSVGFAQRIVNPITNSGCFRQPITPLQTIPPLHSDMNFDCLLGYIFFDSLCRAPLSWEQIDSLADKIQSWDTLKILMRFKYRMSEYNSDLYNEYLVGAGSLTTNYHSPGALDAILDQKMASVLGRKNKFRYLTNADLILHIRVTEVHSDNDTMASSPAKPLPLQCVTATIIDTIKGKYIRQCQEQVYYTQATSPCISFDFSPYWEKENPRGDVVDGSIDSTTGNVTIPCNNCYGSNTVEANKDYIVFLRNIYLDYNGTSSFYTFWPSNGYNAEGGIFPIDSGGNVVISSNYFGYGTSIPLAQFESLLRADIGLIVNH